MSQLSQIDQTTDPFTIVPVGGANSFQLNNLGFRRSDGLLYGYRLSAPRELVTIDTVRQR